jgi:hypothetical protein
MSSLGSNCSELVVWSTQKLMNRYAELAHAQQDAMSTHSRSSASLQSNRQK